MSQIKYYIQLLKFKLSITVVFSAVAGYLLGIDIFNLTTFLNLIIGGFLITGSANGLNQCLESNYDALMKRTSIRPLPLKNLNLTQAYTFSVLIGIAGLFFLNQIGLDKNWIYMSKSAFFGLLSVVLYVLVYTPLKRVSPFSIVIGAIPGAIPFLLGYVAATDNFGLFAGTLFAIQFFWQFPHFIAIAWVQDAEYKKAGFKMMFGKKKGKYPATIAVLNSVLMTIVSIMPFFWIFTQLNLSIYGFIIILFLGLWLTWRAVTLYSNCDDVSAKKLMFGSFIYLPLMQVIYVLDKFLI